MCARQLHNQMNSLKAALMDGEQDLQTLQTSCPAAFVLGESDSYLQAEKQINELHLYVGHIQHCFWSGNLQSAAELIRDAADELTSARRAIAQLHEEIQNHEVLATQAKLEERCEAMTEDLDALSDAMVALKTGFTELEPAVRDSPYLAVQTDHLLADEIDNPDGTFWTQYQILDQLIDCALDALESHDANLAENALTKGEGLLEETLQYMARMHTALKVYIEMQGRVAEVGASNAEPPVLQRMFRAAQRDSEMIQESQTPIRERVTGMTYPITPSFETRAGPRNREPALLTHMFAIAAADRSRAATYQTPPHSTHNQASSAFETPPGLTRHQALLLALLQSRAHTPPLGHPRPQSFATNLALRRWSADQDGSPHRVQREQYVTVIEFGGEVRMQNLEDLLDEVLR